MPSRRHVLATGAGALLTGLGAAASAQDAFQVEPGFTLLFNGRDLTGWRAGNVQLQGKTETANKKWQVRQGVVTIDGEGGGDLYTVREFPKEFYLKLEFRAEEDADSGLYLRGTQLQVRDYPKAGPSNYAAAAKPAGQWNELDIVVRNAVPTVRVNGRIVDANRLEADLKSNPPQVRLDNEVVNGRVELLVTPAATVKLNGQVIEPLYALPVTGPIGLQSEKGKMEFRRIRIREL